jgi:hypothetical protein
MLYMAAEIGIEPPTRGFSTDCVKKRMASNRDTIGLAQGLH